MGERLQRAWFVADSRGWKFLVAAKIQLPNVTRFTLQTQANPAFTVYNPTALDAYMDKVGGYAVQNINGEFFAAKLDKNTWTKFADGTPVTDPSKFETMVHMPRLYFKADGATIQLSSVELPDFRYFDSPEWVAAYKLSFDGSLPHSCPGVAPQHTMAMSQFWEEAQLLGENWGLANYQFHCQINALFQARFGNLNSQAIIGAGFQNANWEAARDVPMGLLIALGDGSGNVLYQSETLGDQFPVKLFGLEDLWGKLWEFRPGIRFEMRDGVRYAIVYPDNVVSNTAEGREFVCAVQSASGDYVKDMELGPNWDMIAQNVTGGGSSTYYCDGYYAATTGQLLFVGGPANSDGLCGLSYASSRSAFSSSSSSIGARLAFYGSPTIISGAEFVQLLATRRSMPAPEVPADDNRTDDSDNPSIEQGNER